MVQLYFCSWGWGEETLHSREFGSKTKCADCCLSVGVDWVAFNWHCVKVWCEVSSVFNYFLFLPGFRRKEFRGKLAIAITANFINRNTTAEAKVEEISGVAFIFNQKFFQDLKEETGGWILFFFFFFWQINTRDSRGSPYLQGHLPIPININLDIFYLKASDKMLMMSECC